MAQIPLINQDPDILGGTPVFTGTRVPIQNLIDYLEGNQNLDEFLDDFPSVQRDQAIGVLELLTQQLLSRSYPTYEAQEGVP